MSSTGASRSKKARNEQEWHDPYSEKLSENLPPFTHLENDSGKECHHQASYALSCANKLKCIVLLSAELFYQLDLYSYLLQMR